MKSWEHECTHEKYVTKKSSESNIKSTDKNWVLGTDSFMLK